jgi:hypothetical protein
MVKHSKTTTFRGLSSKNMKIKDFLVSLKEKPYIKPTFQAIQKSFLACLLVKFTVFILSLYLVISFPVVYITVAGLLAIYLIGTVLWLLLSTEKKENE